ncbi:MAG: hypothetical protein ABDH20_07995 [Thermus sp.]
MGWIPYGLNMDSEDFLPLTHILFVQEDELQDVEGFEAFVSRFASRALPLESRDPSTLQLAVSASEEEARADLLRKGEGFQDLGNGWRVALLGRAGDTWIRAWTYRGENGLQWGVEAAEGPGTHAGVTLIWGKAEEEEEAERLATKRGRALLAFLEGEDEEEDR